MSNLTKIALVDDHSLLRAGLANLLRDLDYEILFECNNGAELESKIEKFGMPEVVLMDIHMPEMDGYDSTLWLSNNYPLVNVLALSMTDDENAIIKMIRNGARGYLLKDSNPKELKVAIESVLEKGFYHSDLVTGRLVHTIRHSDDDENKNKAVLNKKEIEFLRLVCTEMTYKEIAAEMHLSPRTIDGYRDCLFEKLNVKSRVGLVIYAVKNGIVAFT